MLGPMTDLKPLPEDWDRALAVVAHPDDMEYGAGAAVARWTGQGKTVVYCMVTSGEAGIDGLHPEEAGPLREQEQLAACAAVGVETCDFLRQPDLGERGGARGGRQDEPARLQVVGIEVGSVDVEHEPTAAEQLVIVGLVGKLDRVARKGDRDVGHHVQPADGRGQRRQAALVLFALNQGAIAAPPASAAAWT